MAVLPIPISVLKEITSQLSKPDDIGRYMSTIGASQKFSQDLQKQYGMDAGNNQLPQEYIPAIEQRPPQEYIPTYARQMPQEQIPVSERNILPPDYPNPMPFEQEYIPITQPQLSQNLSTPDTPTAKGGEIDYLYHVTPTEYVDSIKKSGLNPMARPSNWVKAGDKTRYGKGEIYTFENPTDAAKWAAKMDWDLNKDMGSGKISIVRLKKSGKWTIDESDPMGQATAKGKWLKSITGAKASDIDQAIPLTPDITKRLVGIDSDVGDMFSKLSPTTAKGGEIDIGGVLYKKGDKIIGVIDLRDGKINNIYNWKQVKDADGHHNIFMRQSDIDALDNNEALSFYVDETGKIQESKGEVMPKGIEEKIREQLSPKDGNKLLEAEGKRNKFKKDLENL